MADAADEAVAPPRSIKDRIAALNLNKTEEQTPSSPPPSYNQVFPEKRKAPPPPLPRRPHAEHRSVSTNNPPVLSAGVSSTKPIGNQPALQAETTALVVVNGNGNGNGNGAVSARPSLPARPARTSTNDSNVPSLPPRRPSEQVVVRRPSNESIASTVSARSVGSALSSRTSASTSRLDGKPRMLAPEYDPGSLPPLPEKKVKEEAKTNGVRTSLRPMKSTPNIATRAERGSVPPLPTRSPAPALPGRPTPPSRTSTQKQEEPTPTSTLLPPPAKRVVKAPLPRQSALDYAKNNPLSKTTNTVPPIPSSRPGATNDAAPPPIPRDSRPDLAALQASKPKMGVQNTSTQAPPASDCLICRDFSAPDAHAKRFPRQSIPSHDPTWLGRELTAPFASHTDKARALFTWLHHNVAYDTVNFFAGTVKRSTPSGVISSGMAVCEGYAGLFSALALAAGLEAVTVGGHGKGYGHSALADDAPVPPMSTNHAWNAVRIDGGRWKLIDCCWGAGQLDCGSGTYKANFAPERFTQSNEDFGLDHWPQDQRHFYRADGRVLGWEEYILQDARPEKRMVYGNVSREHGIRKASIQPAPKHIRLNDLSAPGPTLRFQMEKACRHWRNDVHGAGPDMLFLLEVQGRDGRNKDMHPLDTDGYFHWIDMPRVELGAPGQKVRLVAVTKMDGKDGRGLTKEHYLERKGRCGMAWGYVADWELVH